MNKYISSTFDDLKQEEASYRQSVENALLDYRRTMSKATEQAKQYKDEAAFIDGKKATAKREAQTAIQLAENAFTVAVNVAVKSLKDDLAQHLTTRPSPAFLDAVKLYHDFGIRPSHAEVEALMTLNGGTTLGYRVINQVLKDTHSEYTIDAPDSAAYESDLAALEKLAEGHIMYAPSEYYHEAVEVFGGEPHPLRRADGSRVDVGYKWDHISILTASGSYEGKIRDLDDMSARWSSTVLPSLKHVDAYKDITDPETGETVTAAQQMAQDIRATATAPEIEPSATVGERIAAQMAKEAAENNERSQEILKRYTI